MGVEPTEALDVNARAMEVVERGELVPPQLALETRAAAVYCTEIAVHIISQAFRYSGLRHSTKRASCSAVCAISRSRRSI